MNLSARPVHPDEADVLAELRHRARTDLEGERGARLLLENELADVAFAPDATDAMAWFGCLDDTPIAYALATTMRLADGSTHGVLSEVAVEPEGRGIGVGECLMDAALDWFALHGCQTADAYALPGMRHSKNFYERSGFTARLLVMHRVLEDK